jgi:hypothetical protein
MIVQEGSSTAVKGPIIPGLIAVGCLSKAAARLRGTSGINCSRRGTRTPVSIGEVPLEHLESVVALRSKGCGRSITLCFEVASRPCALLAVPRSLISDLYW